MRNLKRALSLALASVMLVGMMVTGAGAASFPDVTDEQNVEAIEVLNAVEVMIGDNGDFRPDDNVTRNEMAVVMAKLILGKDADSYVGTHPFTDVPEWADKYVAACYNEGIVAGREETVYDGQATVTAQEAAAMMLRALGYEKLEKFGDGYPREIVKYANKISLFADVGSNPTMPMTRNAVAQLALNTLEATVVDAKVTEPIEVNGVKIPGTQEYTNREVEVKNGSNVYAIAFDPGKTASSTATKYTVQLGELLYDGDLKKENAQAADNDDFGRAASNVWSMKNEKVFTVSDEPVAVFTASTSAGDVAKELRSYKFKDSTASPEAFYNINDNDKIAAGGKTTSATVNGSGNFALAAGKTTAEEIHDETANGKLVEIYAKDNVITNIVTVTYGVAEVSSVTSNKNGTTYRLDSGDSGIIYNEDQDKDDTIVLAGDIAEDDIVTYAQSIDGKTLYVYPTTSFEGTQTSRNDSKNTIVVDGKTYDTAIKTTSNTNFPNEEGTFYVDQYGFVVKSDAVATETSWAVVNDIVGVTGSGLSSSKYAEAQLFFPDGTKTNAKVVKIGNVELKNATISAAGSNVSEPAYVNGKVGSGLAISTTSSENGVLKGRIVKYSVKDNEYTLNYADVEGTARVTAQAGVVKNGGSGTKNVTTKGVPKFLVDSARETSQAGTGSAAADNNTIYIIRTGNEKFDYYTGFKNVPDVVSKENSAGVPVKYALDDGKVAVVYIDASVAANADVTGSSSDVFYVTNKKYSAEKDGDDTIYVLEGILNGVNDEIRTETESVFTGLTENTLVKLTLDGDGYVTAVEAMGAQGKEYESQDIPASKEEKDGIVADKTYDDDTVVYVIDDDESTEGNVKSVKAGDKVYIKVKGASGADAETIEIMYVIKDGAAAAKNVLGTPTKPANATKGLTVASVAVTKDDTNKTAVSGGDELTAGTYRVVVTLSGTVSGGPAVVTLAGVTATGTATPTDASKITVNTGAAAPTSTTFTLVTNAVAASSTEIVFKFTVAEAAAGTATTTITPAITIE